MCWPGNCHLSLCDICFDVNFFSVSMHMCHRHETVITYYFKCYFFTVDMPKIL